MENFTPNMNVKLKNGGRKAMKMTVPEFVQRYKDFCEKIRDTYDYDQWWMTDEECDEGVMYGNTHYELPVIKGDKYVGKFKVEFDMENYDLVDLDITSTGIPYLVVRYGGDWEVPLVVFYYFDDKGKLRNYIPTKGNTFNTITKTAFGSEHYADNYKSLCAKYNCDENGLAALALRKCGLPVHTEEDIADADDDEVSYMLYDVLENLEFNLLACEEDFASRVTV